MRPRFTVRLFTLADEDPGDWHHVLDQARAAERAGVDCVIVSGEHVVFGEDLDAYNRPELGGRADRKLETGPDAIFLDPLIAAGVTDVHAFLSVPRDGAAAEDYLAEWVVAFRAATV